MNSTRWIRIAGLAMVTAAWPLAAVRAVEVIQPEGEANSDRFFVGMIASYNPSTGVLVLRNPAGEFTFHVTMETPVTGVDNQPARTDDLRMGDKVVVLYTPGRGDRVVRHVVMADRQPVPLPSKR